LKWHQSLDSRSNFYYIFNFKTFFFFKGREGREEIDLNLRKRRCFEKRMDEKRGTRKKKVARREEMRKGKF
jgi:hypothetical protein